MCFSVSNIVFVNNYKQIVIVMMCWAVGIDGRNIDPIVSIDVDAACVRHRAASK